MWSPTSFFPVVLVLGLVLSTGVAWAGPKFFDPSFSTCTGANCSSESYRGTYTHDQFSNADPFIAQLFTFGGECVRLEVTSTAPAADLETVLSCPNGTVFRGDDSGVGLHPLVKAITPDNRDLSEQDAIRPSNFIDGPFNIAAPRAGKGGTEPRFIESNYQGVMALALATVSSLELASTTRTWQASRVAGRAFREWRDDNG